MGITAVVGTIKLVMRASLVDALALLELRTVAEGGHVFGPARAAVGNGVVIWASAVAVCVLCMVKQFHFKLTLPPVKKAAHWRL